MTFVFTFFLKRRALTFYVCCRRTSGVKVVLGAHSLSGAEDTKQTFDAEVYNHPDFSISNYDNDIALVKVHAVVCHVAENQSVHSNGLIQFVYKNVLNYS